MIVSIDIGTSASSISMLAPDGNVIPVDIGTGVSLLGSNVSIPSAVYVEENGELMLGQAAVSLRGKNPQNFRDEFKRNFGETIPIPLGSRSFLPENLYTEFFRHMKSCAEKVSGEQVELAYLTYPASYGKSKKNKIISAAEAAGLFNVELVDEPTAAAMSYCAAGYVKDGQNLLIYDFGGGTFDVSIVRYEKEAFCHLASPKGLERCGGVDINRLIFRDMISKISAETLEMLQKNPVIYMRFVTQLSELAVKCKHQLSYADRVDEYIMVGFDAIAYSLTLEDYNRMIAEMVGQTIQTCRQALEEAHLKVSDLSAVLLVGGTSRVRLVREMVEQMAGKVPVYCSADLELAVSQGALHYRNFKQAEPELDAEGWYQKGVQLEKEKKLEDAASCYQNAALMDHPKAQFALGVMYSNGEGVPQNQAESVRWYQKAAEQGHERAQFNLALYYKPLRGTAVDAKKGAYWYRKAAEQGDEAAQYELAKCYESGEGIEKDKAEAVRWYQKAAKQGWDLAYLKLAFAYEHGEGVPRDPAQARKWYQLAAAENYQEAKDKLKQLEENERKARENAAGQQVRVDGNRDARQNSEHETTEYGDLLDKVCIDYVTGLIMIKPDGSAWNSKHLGEIEKWKNMKCLCGDDTIFGLRKDGTVTAYGGLYLNEYDVSGWRNIRTIACGSSHIVGLREDGTVVATGRAAASKCYVSTWRNICMFACGADHVVGLRKDGTVVATGSNEFGQCNVSGWRDIRMIACSNYDTVGLRKDGTVVATLKKDEVSKWRNIRMIACGVSHIVGLCEDGTVVAAGSDVFDQCNVSKWRSIRMIACGSYGTVGLQEDGTVVMTANGKNGEKDASSWRDIVAIKAMGHHIIGIHKEGKVRFTRYVLASRRTWFGLSSTVDAKALPSGVAPAIF